MYKLNKERLDKAGYTTFDVYGFWEITNTHAIQYKFPTEEQRDEVLAICLAEDNGYKYDTFRRFKICKKERLIIAQMKEFAGYDESDLL